MASTAQEIYVTGLKNEHALETQAVQLLSRQVERIENYPEQLERMRSHLDASKTQAKRLEEILARYNTSESTLKDLATGFMGNMAALAHAPMQDEILKNSFANYAFEHFEIASYQGLLEMAAAAGDSAGMDPLRQSLREEIAMAEWLGQHLPDVVRRYIARETAGQTSGI